MASMYSDAMRRTIAILLAAAAAVVASVAILDLSRGRLGDVFEVPVCAEACVPLPEGTAGAIQRALAGDITAVENLFSTANRCRLPLAYLPGAMPDTSLDRVNELLEIEGLVLIERRDDVWRVGPGAATEGIGDTLAAIVDPRRADRTCVVPWVPNYGLLILALLSTAALLFAVRPSARD